MNTTRRQFLGSLALGGLGATDALAQNAPATSPVRRQQPPPVHSPEIHPDRRVTFRYRSASAKKVEVSGEWGGGSKAMTKESDNVWSVTIGPLQPELYGYGFVVDGLRVIDPANPYTKPARAVTTSVLDLPGQPPLIHDWQEVPHGVIHQHDYVSKATGSLRRLLVYTPPGYGETRRKTYYPVLYLLHGSGDNEATWTALGRAHWITDNLLAQKKCVPMVIVMTNGHAIERRTEADRWRNVEMYEKELIESVIPLVEGNYTVRTNSDNRGIIGLSMGGQQSLAIGLRNSERFAWVGGMSSAVREPDATIGPILKEGHRLNRRLELLWFQCGIDDFLLSENRAFSSLLNERGIRHGYKETPGNHSWPVWRKYLAEYLPVVFKD